MVNEGEHRAQTAVLFSGGLYDVLKFSTTILLPGLGTLYFTVAQIWGLPYAEEVVGTITALVTFLGLALGVSSKQYNKQQASPAAFDGALSANGVDPDTTMPNLQLTLTRLPDELMGQDEVRLKVDRKGLS